MPTKSRDARTLSLSNELKKHTVELAKELDRVKLPSDIFVYNPLNYAREAYFKYLDTYAHSPLAGLFLGMNPGPHGMMQTGVPFGDIPSVKNYLQISGGVTKPAREHLRRPIEGFDCAKREVSGTRLWGLFENSYANAEIFFSRYFVFNYCPLGFLNERGANLTPDKIPARERKQIEDLCDEHLRQVVPLLNPKKLIGIGAYAAKVFLRLFPSADIMTVLHPSPASPAANRGWDKTASAQLQAAGLADFVA